MLGRKRLIPPLEEGVCSRSRRTGQFFYSFRRRRVVGGKGIHGGGTPWPKAGEMWKCSIRLGELSGIWLDWKRVSGSSTRLGKRKRERIVEEHRCHTKK